MTKRQVSMLLALVLVCTCIPNLVLPAMAQDTDFVIENGVLTKYNGAGGAVTIPESVTAIGEEAFEDCYDLTSVTFGSNVERIGGSAFYGCYDLTSVTFGSNVERISDYAFCGCDLSNVTIPESVSEIGKDAFSGNTNLTEVTILNPDCDIYVEHDELMPDEDGIVDLYYGPFGYGYDFYMDVTIVGYQCSTAEECAALCNHPFRDIEENHPLINRRDLYKTVAYAERLDTSLFLGGETVADYDEALAAAKNVLSDAAASQDTVNAAARAVKDAIAALEPKPDFLFEDVSDPAKFYFDAVYWAFWADPQITNGIDKTHFGPWFACTRGHVVTFLWRAAGCPEPGNTATPFVDVVPGAYYEKAVAWAAENGITNGMDATHFGPTRKCTRGQVVTFLWRTAGKPEPLTSATPFRDMKDGAFYLDAVAWAWESGVTNGMTDTFFGVDAICVRSQVVTFLYRAMGQN